MERRRRYIIEADEAISWRFGADDETLRRRNLTATMIALTGPWLPKFGRSGEALRSSFGFSEYTNAGWPRPGPWWRWTMQGLWSTRFYFYITFPCCDCLWIGRPSLVRQKRPRSIWVVINFANESRLEIYNFRSLRDYFSFNLLLILFFLI